MWPTKGVLSGSLNKFANAENLEVASWWESVKIRIREIFKQGIRSMSTVLYAVLNRFKLEEELVKFPCCDDDQEGYVRKKLDPIFGKPEKDDDPDYRARLRTKADAGVWRDFPNEEDLPDCDVCSMRSTAWQTRCTRNKMRGKTRVISYFHLD